MWKNSLKNVESDNNKILYETLLDFLKRNGAYFLNKLFKCGLTQRPAVHCDVNVPSLYECSVQSDANNLKLHEEDILLNVVGNLEVVFPVFHN